MILRAIQLASLLFVGATALGVVRTRDPGEQAIALSFYGLLLAAMFFFFHAPDVALSQIVVGAVALPLMFVLTLARVRRDREHREHAKARKRDEEG